MADSAKQQMMQKMQDQLKSILPINKKLIDKINTLMNNAPQSSTYNQRQ
jgi:hypothetical protein